jgi:hypothetical protein
LKDVSGTIPNFCEFCLVLAALAPPGQFTAIVAGKNGGIGIALVEICNLK